MPVQDHGQAGYDFQYTATIWLLLAFWEQLQVNGTVSPEGDEDATLVFPGLRIDLQSKSTPLPFDVDALINALMHYPSRDHEHSLLLRVASENNRRVVLVSGGRASDIVQPLIITSAQHAERQRRPEGLRDLAREIKKQLTRTITTHDSKIKDKRLADRIRLSANGLTWFEDALSRVYVLEQSRIQYVRTDILAALSRNHRIRSTRARDVYLELIEVVRERRAGGQDILSAIRDIITSNVGRIAKPKPYVPRGDEDFIYHILQEKRVLLLCGLPQIGKTALARVVAQRFEQAGWEGYECPSIVDAERHLVSDDKRLAILHDPLGASAPAAATDAANVVSRLGNIIRGLENNQAVIVTTRRDIRDATIGANAIGGHPWFELEVADGITEKIWRECAKALRLPAEIVDNVATTIATLPDSERLRPGQARQLVGWEQLATGRINADEMLRYARADEQELCIGLSPDQRTLGLALLTSCDTINSVSTRDLGFILNGSTYGGPSERIDRGWDIEIGRAFGEETAAVSFPHHETLVPLTFSQRQLLDGFERRGFIQATAHNRYRFAHPSYRRVFELAAGTLEHQAIQSFTESLSRAIFSEEVSPANAAATLLAQLTARCHNDASAFVSIAKLGLNSVYPSVVDICFETLSVLARDHPGVAELVYTIASQDPWDENNYCVVNNTILLDPVYVHPAPNRLNSASNAQVEAVRTRASLGETISLLEHWWLLDAYVSRGLAPDVDVVKAGLVRREAIVRGTAVAAMVVGMSMDWETFSPLLRYAVADPHPIAKSMLAKSTQQHFSSLPPETRRALTAALGKDIDAVASVAIAAALRRPWAEGAPWHGEAGEATIGIWKTLVVTVLPHLPLGMSELESRLWNLWLLEEVRKVPTGDHEGARLWLQRVSEQWSTNWRYPTDERYAEMLGHTIQHLAGKYRSDSWIKAIFSNHSPLLRVLAFTTMGRLWELLSEAELVHLHSLFAAASTVEKASLLLGGHGSARVRFLVTGTMGDLPNQMDDLANVVGLEVRDAVLRLYAGSSVDLTMLCIWGSRSSRWRPMIEEAARRADFAYRVEMLAFLILNPADDWIEEFRALCAGSDESAIEELYAAAMRATEVPHHSDILGELWVILASSPSVTQERREVWARELARRARNCDVNDGLPPLHTDFGRLVLRCLPIDESILQSMETMLDTSRNEAERNAALTRAVSQLSSGAYVTRRTRDIAANVAQSLDLTPLRQAALQTQATELGASVHSFWTTADVLDLVE